ncbi:MAG: ATP-binding cassette domain-containing protein [Acidobacteria bacterium]|nr:ATP-binding cassette domain-containing protein [Acidobacteriota bacterium]
MQEYEHAGGLRRGAGVFRAARGRNRLSGHYIEFQNVTKAFGDRVVLDRVSFHVDAGETLVILGRSGVGKSVSLKHILGFLKPDEGRVIVAGKDITEMSEDQLAEIRKRVTMVFQSGALFDSLTVAENVAYPMETRGELQPEQVAARVAELLEMLEVSDVADKLPSELSTGLKRAVAIARALAQDPEAILYDEPTTMVDPIMAGHVGELIRRLKEKFHKTGIVVTHDTHLARRLADHVVFLHEGRVAFFGPWRDFEASADPFLHNFLMQDAQIPALDVVV